MALKEMPKVGEKVRYLRDDCGFLTAGKEYEVISVEGGVFRYVDDEGDSLTDDRFADWVLVPEPQPDVHALLANLGRRLHEVEDALEDAIDRKYYDDMVATYEDTPEVASDAVNPTHYKRGKFETIEVIEHITTGYEDPFVAYCVGNAVKYADRAPYKHDSPAECLRKAAWYLSRAAGHVEAGDSE